MPNKEIKSCPFCGRKPQICKTKTFYDQLHGEPYQNHYLKCCMVTTPTKSDVGECVELWNRRIQDKQENV